MADGPKKIQLRTNDGPPVCLIGVCVLSLRILFLFAPPSSCPPQRKSPGLPHGGFIFLPESALGRCESSFKSVLIRQRQLTRLLIRFLGGRLLQARPPSP